ncbi:TadE/TadG family type IV pilus assembly protein [Vibrio salinus]|uniref:TadE/TadG family type IV pilus assembly protein n=1 Tax=Vibrio salinus TaxID=2899784 RepID=UPI001E2DDA3F|nr:TadE family protein [Vibrio salinus]MCE0494319.1 pilus assembly protein [Vibrio salinus]
MMKRRNRQKGLSIIEFTVVVTGFLIVIFSFIELGLYLYSMQTLNDVSRKAARLGAVCYPSADISTMVTEGKPLGITSEHIQVDYLNLNSGVEFSNPKANPTNDEIGSVAYVRATVVGFSFRMTGILSFLGLGNNGVLAMPGLETVLPAESLGLPHDYDPDNPSYDTCQ